MTSEVKKRKCVFNFELFRTQLDQPKQAEETKAPNLSGTKHEPKRHVHRHRHPLAFARRNSQWISNYSCFGTKTWLALNERLTRHPTGIAISNCNAGTRVPEPG